MKLARITAVALLAVAGMANALEVRPYSAAELAKAQKDSKPVALHFHADWCPTCRAQTQALETLKKEQGLDVTVLVANYDTEKELKRHYGVRAQSTLIAFKGDKETGRVIGDTSPEGIKAVLKSAL
jgi:thiol-disulfide isomerase/thioredoxin